MREKANGEAEFSDTPRKAVSSSEVVPDRVPLTQQQKDDAQLKARQQKQQATDLEAQRVLTQDNPARRENEAVEQAATVPDDLGDGEAMENCYEGTRLEANGVRRLNDADQNRRIQSR